MKQKSLETYSGYTPYRTKGVAVVNVRVNEKLSYEENNVTVYKKLNKSLPYNLVIPLLRSYPTEMKSHVHTTTDI